MNSFKLGKSLLVVAAVVISAFANASLVDATIVIDRAANNKMLTVRYDGAAATLVELRINGKSVASRPVSANENSGETNFTVDVAALQDGVNKVEVRLYDNDGKILGTQTSDITVDRNGTGPVYLTSPKGNDTVQGLVDIKVGFKDDLKNAYVSFFVDDDFKILKNFAPYTYSWDTTGVTNGWHEVQAWVVDEANATFKTQKMRLFVNNPGGRTNREDPVVVVPKTAPATKPESKPATTTAPAKVDAKLDPKAGGLAGVRPVATSNNLAAGPRLMNSQPKVDGKAPTTKPSDVVALNTTAPKLKPVSVGFGTKVNFTGTFDISLNGKPVDFDVAPRVVDGVPLSPFRHLFEGYGGKVKWDNATKTVEGESDEFNVVFTIGNPAAKVGKNTVYMEMAPYIISGRSMVPLSFMSDALKVNVQFDPNTGHVIILSDRGSK